MIPRIRLVQIKNYKSLASVAVELEPFTVLVGPNGSGKSNFIDSLAFVQECMVEPLEVALNRRGGVAEIISRLDKRRPIQFPREVPPDRMNEYLDRSAKDARSMGFRVLLDLGQTRVADYAFEITPFDMGWFVITRERCIVQEGAGDRYDFEVRNGRFVRPIEGIMPTVRFDRLALVAASATEKFRPVYDFLSSMRVYSISPGTLRIPQEPDPGYSLKRDGSNAAAVLRNLSLYGPQASDMRDRLVRLLSRAVKGITWVRDGSVGTKETLWFDQDLDLGNSTSFNAISMSDGTLRVLGLLLAVYQPMGPSVVGIEEPELTVHPALAEMIFEVLKEASQQRQVLITTHSPDILDQKELGTTELRIVNWVEGGTVIARVPDTARQTIKENLYTAGELMRIGELDADGDSRTAAAQSVDLFGPFLDEVFEDQ